jgi:hypothetical protein
MAGRYGRGVYIRNLSVYSPHSATTLGGVHTFRHIEKKHSNETRERTNCWEDLQAKIVLTASLTWRWWRGHNKGFIRPHSYCVRPELGFASHRGLRRVASFRPFKSVQVGDTGPAESTRQGNLQRVGLLFLGSRDSHWVYQALIHLQTHERFLSGRN